MTFSLKTSLCEKLGIRSPIVLAPMAGVAGGALAGAVSRAGGLGLLGVGYADPNWIKNELALAEFAPIGVGFITWYLAQHPEQLDAVLEHKLAAVMFSFGEASPFIARFKAREVPVLMQVQTVAMAREAVARGADVIVAQGADGGGHGARRGTFALLPAVVDEVAPVPVIAAGGIADGRGLAAALVLGASGVLVGTRFYASTEALGSPAAKQALVQNSGDHTVRTRVFDIVRGYHWPDPFTGRALVNRFTERWHGNEPSLGATLETASPAYWAAAKRGELDTAVVWASEDIDLIKAIEPAGAILSDLLAGARKSLVSDRREA